MNVNLTKSETHKGNSKESNEERSKTVNQDATEDSSNFKQSNQIESLQVRDCQPATYSEFLFFTFHLKNSSNSKDKRLIRIERERCS
jgi:hypothetical protein